ncbi:hypothetical protein BGW42_005407 [Actinomortierella wolfii]|nr:hypothetical protein BGW42_005407 [Actinomortierella wolfii]
MQHATDNATAGASNHELREEEQDVQEEYDRYKDFPELLGIRQTPRRLFSYDWASNYVSPFRSAPEDTLANLLDQIDCSTEDSMLVDLGCGDGIVLAQALRRHPELKRVVGIDLDRTLLDKAKDSLEDIITNHATKGSLCTPPPQPPRAELYCGDLTNLTDPIELILDTSPSSVPERPQTTVGAIIQQSSHLFVYHLPTALQKLGPILLDAVENQGKIVLSMQWEIPALEPYLVYGGPEQNFRIYRKK